MMITLALTTGMRRGELLGLEWKHIDWKTGVIDVSQTLIHALKGEIIVKEPKTKNSKRKVALPPSVLEELREYYSYRVKERDKLGDAWNGKDRDGRNGISFSVTLMDLHSITNVPIYGSGNSLRRTGCVISGSTICGIHRPHCSLTKAFTQRSFPNGLAMEA